MQMESSLTGHKHKANQIDNEQECTNQSRKGPCLYCMAIRRGTKTNEDSQRRDRDLKRHRPKLLYFIFVLHQRYNTQHRGTSTFMSLSEIKIKCG
ncbi:hypothetical protein RIR_jg9223.t1 [Rhizophagus irregularis DAOM 181602=DAOM 197198]|nr:hypothetical protein RIR_jg9223.t1 [Rhizophagus irregularis DAOM 181602=DAOM 197198]